MLDELAQLNQIKLREIGDPEIATRISQYELAYRMQTSVPGLTDISDEPEHVVEMYGPNARTPGNLRRKLSIGPANGRARRPFRATLPHGLGSTHQRPQGSARPDERHRSTLGCTDPGSEATGACWTTRSSSGAVNSARTVYCQGNMTDANYGPRPSSSLLLRLARGGRHQAGHYLRPDRRPQLQHHAGSRPRARLERHDLALPGHRPQAAHVQVSGPPTIA